jgi:hypothetical protein
MVSHPPSSSDRQANGRSGAGSGHGKAERTPGTPRKDGGAGKDKAVQDPGLKDYVSIRSQKGETYLGLYMEQRLGECLGKGAFGSVYKAFNWGTGEAVAVKQIKLGDLPKSELRMIEVGCWPYFIKNGTDIRNPG